MWFLPVSLFVRPDPLPAATVALVIAAMLVGSANGIIDGKLLVSLAIVAMAIYFGLSMLLATILGALSLTGWRLAMPAMVTPAGIPVGALMPYCLLPCGMTAALLCANSEAVINTRPFGRSVGDAKWHRRLVWLGYGIGQALILSAVGHSLDKSADQGRQTG